MKRRNDLCDQLKDVFRIAKQLAGGAEMSLALDLVRRLKHICAKVDLEHLNSAEEDKELLASLDALFEKDPAALLRLATVKASYFHTAAKEPFVDFQVDGHRVTLPLRGDEFPALLRSEFFSEKKRAPAAGAVKNTIETLCALAIYGTKELHEVHLRVAGVSGKIYLDLGDETYQAIELDAEGWRIVDRPSVRFRRPSAMAPLPRPQRGGSINTLRKFVNLSDDGFVLFVAVLLYAFCPDKPHPVLYLSGEQGVAKSTATKIARLLIDPVAQKELTRKMPESVRDLYVAARNAHLLGLNNISKITPDISDALCQLASGEGYSKRKNYTDGEEFVVGGWPTLVLNGRINHITRSDLADRTVNLQLAPISPQDRRDESGFWSEFHDARPQIFGALLDAVVCGIRELPRVRLTEKGRMVDFELFAHAAEGAYAHAGAFRRAYYRNAEEANEAVIEAEPVVIAIRSFMADKDHWRGTATQLRNALTEADRTEQRVSRWRSWPRDPSGFSVRLRDTAATLRKIGIAAEFGKRDASAARNRIIELYKVPRPDTRGGLGSSDPDRAQKNVFIFRRNNEL
jgi:hypothetical protein